MAEKAVEQQVFELTISKLELEDLISSIVDDIGAKDTEMMGTQEYHLTSAAFTKAERKAKEVSKNFNQSLVKAEKYMEAMLAEEKELEEEVRKKQEEAANSHVVDEDSDDDVTIIEPDFEPRRQLSSAPPSGKQPSHPLATKQLSHPQESAQVAETQGQQFILQHQTLTPVGMVVSSASGGSPPSMAHVRAALTDAINRQVTQSSTSLPERPKPHTQMIMITHPKGKLLGPASVKERLKKSLTTSQSTSTPISMDPMPAMPAQWRELVVGSKVLAKKFNDIWYSGVITDIQKPENARHPGEYKYRVKFDGKGVKNLTGHHIAYRQPVNCFLKVGTRVAALYRDDEATTGSSFYAGIVAEAPSLKNNKRYLVFFDDGYAQYCLAKELHKVYYQSENVWEDIHPDSQEFIKEYLKQYPERPMVRLMQSQIVKTEWNGRWWTAKVMEVDASLVKMYFQADKRTEWIYRGSTRLEPLFKALANAEAIKAAGSSKGRRLNMDVKGQKRPTVEYTRGISEDSSKKVSKPSTKERRPVARKSTGGGPSQIRAPRSLTAEGDCAGASVSGWEAPWLKLSNRRQPVQQSKSVDSSTERFEASSISSNKQGRDMASVLQERLASAVEQGECVDEGEALGQRLDTLIDTKDKIRKKFVPHTCCSACVKDAEEDKDKHKGKNPLLIPLLCGWERQICKMRPGGRKCVIYRAPCARRLRSIEELDEYLALTDSQMFIDYFCYDTWLHVHTEFVPVKTFCDIKDLSYGKENVPISCVNGIDRQYPDYVEYSSYRIPSKGVKIPLDEGFLQCCDCTDNCRDRSKCACQQLTIENTTWIGERDPKAGYHNRRLIEPIFTGVVECNSRCKCDSRCRNRVAQNGLSCRLQVFKTEKRGWGLRCLNDIPKGGFICIYAGQLLTDTGANDDGKQYGDEYLAELDFIEVVERQKEGYESDVEDPEADDSMEKDNADEEDEDDDYESNDCRDDAVSSDSDYDAEGAGSGSVVHKVHETRRRRKQDESPSATESSSEQKETKPLSKLVLKRDSADGHEWTTEKMDDSPIEIADDEDEDSHLEKKGAAKSESMEVEDELPDLVKPEEKPEVKAEPVKMETAPNVKEEKVKKDESPDEHEGQMAHRARKSTGGSRFKNLPNPKNVQSGPPAKDDDEKHRVGTRALFCDGTSCYIMDAKSMGNIGRYLNHSCSPNVFVQNIFVDTHDLRYPWVAFFAGQYIRAGTELTWDYNYEVGSVPDKVLYCYCGSPMCRGRLL